MSRLVEFLRRLSWQVKVGLALVGVSFPIVIAAPYAGAQIGAAIFFAGLTFLLVRLTYVIWMRGKPRVGRGFAALVAAIPGGLAVLLGFVSIIGFGVGFGLVDEAAVDPSPPPGVAAAPMQSPTVRATATPSSGASPSFDPTTAPRTTPSVVPTAEATVDPVVAAVETYMTESFGPPFEPPWWSHIEGFDVQDGAVVVLTDLISYDEQASNICSAASNPAFFLPELGLREGAVVILGRDGQVIWTRSEVPDPC